ncbi:MAG: hypothetical protein N2747_10935 [Chitinophagaceae bacterium]|nr:hypothetical protein [Chitinophagaceae bacterium]
MMNVLLVFSFLQNILLSGDTSQPCRLIKETDPYTKETRLSSGFLKLNGASVTMDADSKELIFLFSVEGKDRCFDNGSTAEISFEGLKTKMIARNAGTMNCDGSFQFVFKNTHNAPTTLLQRMSTRKITQIVFTGNNKKTATVTLAPREQELFMRLADCIVKEGRQLIK